MIGSTVVRAHQHAAGARKQRGIKYWGARVEGCVRKSIRRYEYAISGVCSKKGGKTPRSSCELNISELEME